MNGPLKHLLEEYAELEQAVQELISAQCGPVCGLCTVACCCRADLCEEALESPFLSLLHKRDELESDRYGFLTEYGCALRIGRPPVCYEFFCDEVLAIQKDDTHRDLLSLLGKLVSHAGKNAPGHSHLVEISDEDDLDRLSLDPFKENLNQARAALNHVRFFYDNGFFEQGALEQFRPILDPPEPL